MFLASRIPSFMQAPTHTLNSQEMLSRWLQISMALVDELLGGSHCKVIAWHRAGRKPLKLAQASPPGRRGWLELKGARSLFVRLAGTAPRARGPPQAAPAGDKIALPAWLSPASTRC